MREHPIPQDVVGYRFHIVGNMTIKQFAELGAGCLLGFIIYSTNLFDILKWPLIGLSVATGALAAFVPFEERPLDHWLMTFVKVLYKPTQFYWRREPRIPDVFTFQSNQTQQTDFEVDLSPARRARIQEFLQSLRTTDQPDEYEAAQQQQVSQIMGIFQTVQVAQVDSTHVAQRPNLTVRPRSLKSLEDEAPQPVVEEAVIYMNPAPPATPVAEAPQYDIAKPAMEVTQVGGEIQIPETHYISIQDTPAIDATTQTTVADENLQVFSTVTAAPVIDVASQQTATMNNDLPFPTKPTEPNKLVGMVLTPRNELINDAIIEIRTEQGNVARAVKTNALGQFFITTPLNSGSYVLQAEKDGFSFAPQQITLTGQAVDPLEIRSLT